MDGWMGGWDGWVDGRMTLQNPERGAIVLKEYIHVQKG